MSRLTLYYLIGISGQFKIFCLLCTLPILLTFWYCCLHLDAIDKDNIKGKKKLKIILTLTVILYIILIGLVVIIPEKEVLLELYKMKYQI